MPAATYQDESQRRWTESRKSPARGSTGIFFRRRWDFLPTTIGLSNERSRTIKDPEASVMFVREWLSIRSLCLRPMKFSIVG